MKNKIKWVGNTENFTLENDIKILNQQLKYYQNEEKEIDKWTEYFSNALADLAKDDNNSQYSYVNFDDLKGIENLTKEPNQNFLVIRAPKGTMLEIPTSQDDPDDPNPYKMRLQSNEEPIILYLVSEKSNLSQLQPQ